ncbi:flagellin [Roseburia faecis]|uniref:flagellin N-terminal helical domain-containing protein n=1 Tax=Roseburia faecis TaxID=301302 RepID=UPI001922E370
MVVQHNMTAANANRMLGTTSSAQAKSAEKLSSGYKINRAGDDAAGLKISEKMRSQIRGLNKASDNAQDGISLIQTAEGALNESHSILQRMNELAVQGANDTNQSIDRDAINQELEALTDELDRISQTTQFNKQNLLDGNFKDKKLQVGANANQNIEISIDAMNADSLGLGKEMVTQGGTTPIAVKYDGISYKYDANTTAAKNKELAIGSFKAQISKKVVSAAFTAQYDNTTGSIYYKATIDGKEKRFADATKAKKAYLDDQKAKASAAITNDFQKYVQTSTTAGTTGTQGEVRYGARVDDYESANKTITKVQDAINTVSTQRSALGALQNRLEHTVANLDNVSENTQSAESRIRDTDMASEMVDYSKNNILAQAGQSMLAQANQSTQGVLSLLQ